MPAWIDKHADELRGRTVLMYCTGGVRCERVSALLRQKGPGFERVYQLAGGVQRYLEAAEAGALAEASPGAASSMWAGRLHVFDGRGSIASSGALPLSGDAVPVVASSHPAVLGRCVVCAAQHDLYGELRCGVCGVLVLVCESCRPRFSRRPTSTSRSSDTVSDGSTSSVGDTIHAQSLDLTCAKCSLR